LNDTVPPLPGNVTLVNLFSKSQPYCVVPEESVLEMVLPFASNADPAAVFPLEFSHPQYSSTFSDAVALKRCNVFSLEPLTRVFGYTPDAAKGKNTHGLLDAESVPSLAAVSITPILY
jgi:hypothetical protein